MKTNYLFLAISFAAMTFSSCGDEENEILDALDEQIESQNSIFTYDMYFDSEITSYDGATRATTASDWGNGDVVYIHFYGNNDAFGQAEYIGSSKKWRVTCDKALVEAANNSCYVWFGKGVNPVGNSSYITYDYMTEAYRTSFGEYSYANNAIYVNATLQPRGWRLRFKGAAGTQIRISGPPHYYYLSFFNDVFSDSEAAFNMIVNSNGYTDYFAGITYAFTSSINLENISTGINYYRDFNVNTLGTGESGCYTIPTSSNLHGWTKQ